MKLSIVLIFVLLCTAQVADAVDCYVGTAGNYKMVSGADQCMLNFPVTDKKMIEALMLAAATGTDPIFPEADTDGPEADGSWEDNSQ